jgi:hydroxypyruvate reductase/glycerate 2-kinase
VNLQKKIYIQNPGELTDHGNVALRQATVDILEHALTAVDPYTAIEKLVHLDDHWLSVGDLSIDLKQYERVFILGAGKASRRIAQVLEDILGDWITGGLFVLKHGDTADLKRTDVIYAAHPVPDENSFQGAKGLLSLAKSFSEKDLVIVGVTGGSSALLALPAEGISLEDLQQVNEIILLSGADLYQNNAVRKHLSRIKGGLLAKEILPATLINLTVSDVVGDALDYITGPTVVDTSNFDDARAVLDKLDLWKKFPASACEYLRNGGKDQETPKNFEGMPLHSFIVVPGDAACIAADLRAKELGFNSMILSSMLTGEAREAGSFFASIAQEISTFGRPLEPPCAVIGGGENVVTIGEEQRGEGGPNLEFALAASLEIAGLDQVVIAAIDTDGFDGSTDAAGGLVDGNTRDMAVKRPLNPELNLKNHNAKEVLAGINDLIFTGPTGTNVNDLKLLLFS